MINNGLPSRPPPGTRVSAGAARRSASTQLRFATGAVGEIKEKMERVWGWRGLGWGVLQRNRRGGVEAEERRRGANKYLCPVTFLHDGFYIIFECGARPQP